MKLLSLPVCTTKCHKMGILHAASASFLLLLLLLLITAGQNRVSAAAEARQLLQQQLPECAIQGATYGRPGRLNDSNRKNTVLLDWADTVGVACADAAGTIHNKCYQEASAWSIVAVQHGNTPVWSAQDCHDLCNQTVGCDVWTYWPAGIGEYYDRNDNMNDKQCDLCPHSDGGSVLRTQGYCFPEGDCGICGDLYDYILEGGVPDVLELTCHDLRFAFQDVGCCVYSEEAKESYQARGACELLSAATENERVLSFHGGKIVTGPRDCDETKWLPFLEPTEGPPGYEESKPEIDFEEEGFCNPCPSAYGLILDREKEYEDENGVNTCGDAFDFITAGMLPDIPCDEIVNWMRYTSECCDWSAVEDEQDEDADAFVVNYEKEGFCDPCPSSYGFTLNRENEYEDENGVNKCGDAYDYITAGFLPEFPCEDLAQWMLRFTSCCNPPLDAFEPTIAPTVDNTPRAADGRACWIDNHSYGVKKHGACDDAEIIKVYTSNHTIELGYTQGWWESGVILESYGEYAFSVSDCHFTCLENASCGGWEFKRGSCLLKARLNCTPTIVRDPSALDTVAGVSGCLDRDSEDSQESSALDTSNFWFLDCTLPRCKEPISYGGGFSGDTYVPVYGKRGCWYKQYEANELYEGCTRDRWIVINGGSNVLSFYTQLVNLFAPQSSNNSRPLISFEQMFQYSVVDIVLKGDSLPIQNKDSEGILHLNMLRFCEIDRTLPCTESSLSFQGGTADWPSPYLEALKIAFAAAPYEAGATRLTLVVGQLWTNAAVVLRALGEAGASNKWNGRDIIFYGQAMIWYPCNVEGWCELPELGNSNEELFHKYRSDLNHVMEVGKTTCALDHFDCFFATHAYSTSLGNKVEKMISILQEVTSAYDWAHLIDYNGFVLSDEVVEGHATPAMFLPAQTMIWNTVCDGPATGCPEAISTTPTCWANCLERGGRSSCGYCNDWICMNERQCNYRKLDPVPWNVVTDLPMFYGDGGSEVPCFDAEQIGKRFVEMAQEMNGIKEDSCRRRIWCGSIAAGWAVGVCVFLLGVLVIVMMSYIGKHKETEIDGGKNQMEVSAPVDIEANGIPEAPSIEDDAQDEGSGANPICENDGTVSVQESGPPPKEYLNSLGVARLLASQHIVVGHLYAKGAISTVYFFSWGFTWVPWFYVLSGYVLTHSRLNSSDPTKVDSSPWNHIAKRLSTIYPMYIVGVFFSMVIRVAKEVPLPGIGVLIGQSFLLQSWVPQWTEKALLSQCWFLSGLLVYWGIFGWLYKWMSTLTLTWVFSCLVFVCFLPWLTIIVPVLDDEIETTWYNSHHFGEMDSSTDLWTVMLKYHPIFYFHVFIFGMLLAILRNHLKNENTQSLLAHMLKRLTQCGASIGYIGLILIFSVESMQPTSYKLSTRLSVLLPLQGVMMLGLSPLPKVIENNGFQDPLAILFSYAPAWMGDVSYCQYVLQFAMYDLFPRSNITDASFFLYLWGAALLTYKFIHEPAARIWRNVLSKEGDKAVSLWPSLQTAMLLLVPPVVLAMILGIARGAYSPSSAINNTISNTTNSTNATNFSLLAPFVRLSSEAVDLRLNWTMENETPYDSELVAINPSMILLEDGSRGLKWIRAVRAHALRNEYSAGSYQGENVTEQVMNFHSSIMLQSEPFLGDLSAGFDDEDITKWGLDGIHPLSSTASTLWSHLEKAQNWSILCEPKPTYDNSRKWLVRKVVTGPEDPKLFENPSDRVSRFGIAFSSFPPTALLSEESLPGDCKWGDRAVMQMYLASDGEALASGEIAVGVRLGFGRREDMEKNWVAFTHKDHLHFIYSVEPHRILQVRPTDGAAAEQYETSSPKLQEIARHVFAVRGSATAVKYTTDEYLALLHTYDANFGYSTAAYTFQAQPPFAVRRISKPLPLQGHSFASSLVVHADKVIIGYGEADKSARVLVMSRKHLEEQFDWCS